MFKQYGITRERKIGKNVKKLKINVFVLERDTDLSFFYLLLQKCFLQKNESSDNFENLKGTDKKKTKRGPNGVM